jgi:hypothetical protein
VQSGRKHADRVESPRKRLDVALDTTLDAAELPAVNPAEEIDLSRLGDIGM